MLGLEYALLVTQVQWAANNINIRTVDTIIMQRKFTPKLSPPTSLRWASELDLALRDDKFFGWKRQSRINILYSRSRGIQRAKLNHYLLGYWFLLFTFMLDLFANGVLLFHMTVENQRKCDAAEHTNNRRQREHQTHHDTGEVHRTDYVQHNYTQATKLDENRRASWEPVMNSTHQTHECRSDLSNSTINQPGTLTRACASRRKTKTK